MRQYECHIKPQPGEIIETTLPLPPDSAALITGTVLSAPDTPAEDALVLLLRHEDGELLSATTTDSQGRFYLGPLPSDQLYTLRVQSGQHSTRILELS